MSEIKRIKLKDSDVIQVGDRAVYARHAVVQSVFSNHIGQKVCRVRVTYPQAVFERDIRPLAVGEVIRDGDWYVSDLDGELCATQGVGYPSGVDGWLPHYRPVRMESLGWRYLDVGERRPEGYEVYWRNKGWTPGRHAGSIVEYVSPPMRAPWPPREEKPATLYADREGLKLEDGTLIAGGEGLGVTGAVMIGSDVYAVVDRLIREYEAGLMRPAPRSCIYCNEPDDETMGTIEDLNSKGDPAKYHLMRAHARCAQRASRLQTPEPEPLAGPDLWGEEFEVWR